MTFRIFGLVAAIAPMPLSVVVIRGLLQNLGTGGTRFCAMVIYIVHIDHQALGIGPAKRLWAFARVADWFPRP